MDGISWSLSPGITGATKTATGTPARANRSIASSLRSGLDVRGSITLWRAGTNVVTEIATFTALWEASSESSTLDGLVGVRDPRERQ